jgi:hypothetical protein
MGMGVTVIIFVVMDRVIWNEDKSGIAGAMNKSLGLDLGSTVITTLKTSWYLWPVILMFGWMLYMIIYSIIREPSEGTI